MGTLKKLDAIAIQFAPGESLFSINLDTFEIHNANAKLQRINGKWILIPEDRHLYVAALNAKNAVHKFTVLSEKKLNNPTSKNQA